MGERTPGPWHIKAGCDWMIQSQDVEVAVVYTPRGVRGVREANARFIAAAPDMEKALEVALADGGLRYWTRPILEAALAKARGQVTE